MNQQLAIERVKKVRAFLLELVKELTPDQLNEIPAGFNNNIIWHLGHLTAAQQGICYLRAGLTPVVPEVYIQAYKTGSKPGPFVDSDEIDIIKKNLLTSLDQFDRDVQNNLFTNYNAWTTRYGIELSNIDDALQFLLFHEGLHSGYITAMKKTVMANS